LSNYNNNNNNANNNNNSSTNRTVLTTLFFGWNTRDADLIAMHSSTSITSNRKNQVIRIDLELEPNLSPNQARLARLSNHNDDYHDQSYYEIEVAGNPFGMTPTPVHIRQGGGGGGGPESRNQKSKSTSSSNNKTLFTLQLELTKYEVHHTLTLSIPRQQQASKVHEFDLTRSRLTLELEKAVQ
jgi:hypothetical protein